MRLEAICEPADHTEKCPTCGSAVQRWTYGEVHGGSFISNGKRVDIRGTPPEGYADPIVLDAITQYFDGGLYRMFKGERYPSKGGKKLHLAVWTSVFGRVPSGCHIHHKDDHSLNNALGNLECMPTAEHSSLT